MPKIFISYRQDDAGAWGVLLAEKLSAAFGNEAVFFDKDQLHVGEWHAQLKAALAKSSVVIVLIGPRWLGAVDANKNLRLWQEDDVHRNEILLALSRGVTLMPVLVAGADVPAASKLPDPLRPLVSYEAFELGSSQRRLETDLVHVLKNVGKAIGVSPKLPEPRVAALKGSLRLFAVAGVLQLAVMASCNAREDPLRGGENAIVFALLLLVVSGAERWRRSRRKAG